MPTEEEAAVAARQRQQTLWVMGGGVVVATFLGAALLTLNFVDQRNRRFARQLRQKVEGPLYIDASFLPPPPIPSPAAGGGRGGGQDEQTRPREPWKP